MSNSLWPHGLQHNRPPCPSPTPRVYSNLHALSWWCHPTISSSVIPFSSCPQSSPASGPFPMSQLFASGGQSIGISALALVLPVNNSGLISFRIEWFDLLAVQGTLTSLLQHHSSKPSILLCSAFFIVQLILLKFTIMFSLNNNIYIFKAFNIEVFSSGLFWMGKMYLNIFHIKSSYQLSHVFLSLSNLQIAESFHFLLHWSWWVYLI